MKIYLHGWRNKETGQELFFEQLSHIFKWENITQVLHIPFAKIWVVEKYGSRKQWWFQEKFPEIEFLNARYKEDIQKVDISRIFVLITWWAGNVHLHRIITWYSPLFELVKNAPYILWSSAGMMVIWKQFRKKNDYFDHHEWLWLVDYIGEPHCTARDRKKYLQQYINSFDVETVIWIDEDTILEREDSVFGKTRWEWSSYIVHKEIKK